jgi:hypothetical protein
MCVCLSLHEEYFMFIVNWMKRAWWSHTMTSSDCMLELELWEQYCIYKNTWSDYKKSNGHYMIQNLTLSLYYKAELSTVYDPQ